MLFLILKINTFTTENALWAVLIFITAHSATCFSTEILKFIISEPRPDYFDRIRIYETDKTRFNKLLLDGDKSFPSGHSSLVSCATLFLIIVLKRMVGIRSLHWKINTVFGILTSIFTVFAVCVCILRVVLNKHYIHDVLVGVSLGCLVSFISLKIGWKKNRQPADLENFGGL